MDEDYTFAALEEARLVILSSLDRVHDWGLYIRLASHGLSRHKIWEYRRKCPLSDFLSDDQIQSEFRRLVSLRYSEEREQWASSLPSPASQQPQQQADVVDGPSSQIEGQQLQGVSEGQLQPAEALRGTHDGNIGQPSASSLNPFPSLSILNLGQVSNSTDSVSSPENNWPQILRPAGPPVTSPQVMTPMFPGIGGTPASDVPPSMSTRQREPQSSLPTLAAPRLVAATQDVPSQRFQDAGGERS